MEKMLLKKAAIQSVALMIAVITLSYALKQYQSITMEASKVIGHEIDNGDKDQDNEVNNVEMKGQSLLDTVNLQDQEIFNTKFTNVVDLKSKIDQNILQQLGENFLVIKKPKGNKVSISITDLYINHSISVDLTGMDTEHFTSDMILRIRGKEFFVGDPVYTELTTIEEDKEDGITKEVILKDFGKDISHGITITTKENEKQKQFIAQVLIELDTVYAYIIYEDTNYFYIDLKKPSDVYDKIIVIDPGHGGKDVGAISKNGKYYEKDMNLDIVLQLQKLLEKEDIKVYYTRTEDKTVFLRPRVTLANAVDSDYFISIHCNSNELTSPNGAEVLYYNNEYKGVKVADLAAIFSDELSKSISLRQRGIIKKHPEDIFIMDKAVVPTILIEVAYLSNRNDLNFLINPVNREAVAQGIFNGIMRAYKELPVIE